MPPLQQHMPCYVPHPTPYLVPTPAYSALVIEGSAQSIVIPLRLTKAVLEHATSTSAETRALLCLARLYLHEAQGLLERASQQIHTPPAVHPPRPSFSPTLSTRSSMGQFSSCPRTFACRNRPVSLDESFCIGSEDMEQHSTHTIQSQLVETPDSPVSSDGNQIVTVPRAQYKLTAFPIHRMKPQKPRLQDQWHPPSPVIEEEAGEATTKEYQSLRANPAGMTSYHRRSSCTTVMSTCQYEGLRYITPSKPQPKTIRLCTPPKPPVTPPWPTPPASASMSYQTTNIDLTWGENPIRRCDADTPLTITLTNDVLWTNRSNHWIRPDHGSSNGSLMLPVPTSIDTWSWLLRRQTELKGKPL
ncbi:hypothetical protein QCA50_001341 [Cerrena zonata]|uniref:Uncharacterized protein n=1 Tax=Cerrena zonata TaxID=2478898 RepID=A0AAW0GL42_9APHY